jgi:AraC family transcriptional regulator of adaptative response/methylated-DNA-[protein]-cysteine methyltransferase
LVARVVGFIEAPRIGLDLPFDVRGTTFQQRVWEALREIPAGDTVSYSEIARRIRAPKAVRAVAEACAKNNLAVAIPCHRVVRKDGALSGYAWGVERKRVLLDREASQGRDFAPAPRPGEAAKSSRLPRGLQRGSSQAAAYSKYIGQPDLLRQPR